MTIKTKKQETLLDKLIQDEKSVSCKTALKKVKDMVGYAKNTAYSFAPTPAPTFTYTDTMPTELVNAITDEQKQQLQDVGITFEHRFGWITRVKMKFHTK